MERVAILGNLSEKARIYRALLFKEMPFLGPKNGDVEGMAHKGGSVRIAEPADRRTKVGPGHKHPCPLSKGESFDSHLVEVGNSYQNRMV